MPSTCLAEPPAQTCSTPSAASTMAYELRRHGLGPFLATPCGALAPLLEALGPELLTVSREENAVGVAAGTALAGCRPVVLMQNSGFGASLNAFASLIQPYGVPLLLVISLRGRPPDLTTENLLMGRLTIPVLDRLDIPHRTLTHDALAQHVAWAAQTMMARRRAAALLVPPDLFAWSPT